MRHAVEVEVGLLPQVMSGRAVQVEAGLLPQLAGGRAVQALVRPDKPARQRELAREWLRPAANEQHGEVAAADGQHD